MRAAEVAPGGAFAKRRNGSGMDREYNRLTVRRRRRAGIALVAGSLLMLPGCGLFGGDKLNVPEQEFVPAVNIEQVRKDRPGLPGDVENANHTDEELRGDEDDG